MLSFSLSIDATKVPSELKISTAYATIMGGANPNHNISTMNMTSQEIKHFVSQKPELPTSVKLADKIKVVIMSFQNCTPGVSPVEIIGSCPQTSNEVSAFTTHAIDAALEVSSSDIKSKVFCTNFAVDGASAETESQNVMTTVCKFLDGQARFLGCADNKHNAKTDRYQLIGGSFVATVGNYVVDYKLLRLSGVVKDLWTVHDSASES